ncbi:glycosyltransferase [Pandoraea sputorum]|uniref:glycosyltransferase n=1 Tax=Pandoraea sputorum TaxID=93222 RepID=UPI001241031B|nr:glycosyltransferase family 4 protein [Pandoraea sputorum]VVE58380.1 transferase [Pandoraea sputorum]
MRRLKVLTWQVHGNYLFYLSHAPHDFYIVTKPGNPAGYARCGCGLPWGPNVFEVPYQAVPQMAFDCVLYQHHRHFLEDGPALLSEAQQRLPTAFVEHDPPQEHPTNTRHPVQDSNVMLIHVTPFNALMWDSGDTPARVIEHGVKLVEPVEWHGTLPKGITVVNHLARRGRRLGADVFAQLRREVPLDLVGMDAQTLGGIGEITAQELPRFMCAYRFFFNPIRYTSLGLAVIEAMMAGLPVVALATTEMAMLIRSGHNGVADTRPDVLADAMHQLIRDASLANEWGQAARRDAEARFNIGRFAQDWDRALRDLTQ